MTETKKTSGQGRKPEPRPSREAVSRDYVTGRIRTVQGVASALGVTTEAARSILTTYDVENRPINRKRWATIEDGDE